MDMKNRLTEIEALRKRARQHIDGGAVTSVTARTARRS